MTALQDAIAGRYTPNPVVWKLIRNWRSSYRLALVNNGASATFRRWVKKYGWEYIFNVIANSEELRLSKPDPEFFTTVATGLKLPPQDCILVDDDQLNLEGARSCGMGAIHPSEFNSNDALLEETLSGQL